METGALSIKAFCERFGISHSKTYEEIAAGRLRVVKVGRKTLVPLESARAWLSALPALELNRSAAYPPPERKTQPSDPASFAGIKVAEPGFTWSLRMHTNTNLPGHCHDLSDLPLFAFRRVLVAPPVTRAGMHLTRRYRVHPAIADVIAQLAGLGEVRA